jgi:hypothetical protein
VHRSRGIGRRFTAAEWVTPTDGRTAVPEALDPWPVKEKPASKKISRARRAAIQAKYGTRAQMHF